MIIGIDIDNTISHTTEMILNYVEIFGRENQLNTVADLSEYYLEQSLGWEEATAARFLDTYLPNIYKEVKPKPYAVDVIRELHEKHSIVLVTSRNQQFPYVTEATLEWLNRHELEYDKLVMNNTKNMHYFSKLDACLDNQIELMIEDHHDLVLELSARMPVIMFHYPYNAHISAKNIRRVENWLEIKSVIKSLE